MILRRLSQDSYCTRGELLDDDGQHIAVTLELPWVNGADDVSCIPEGVYRCYRRWSDKHKVFLFGIEAPGRDDLEIHIGNWPHDTEGCVLVGTSFSDDIEGKGAGITDSGEAFKHLMRVMKGVDEFALTVTPPAVTYVERQ
jgi:hypothetical protein